MGSTIIDGIEITENGGTTTFTITEEQKKKDAEELARKRREEEENNKPWYEKLFGWFKKHDAKPYVKIRDLADPFGDRRNDPFDIDAGSDGKNAAEIGFKISF